MVQVGWSKVIHAPSFPLEMCSRESRKVAGFGAWEGKLDAKHQREREWSIIRGRRLMRARVYSWSCILARLFGWSYGRLTMEGQTHQYYVRGNLGRGLMRIARRYKRVGSEDIGWWKFVWWFHSPEGTFRPPDGVVPSSPPLTIGSLARGYREAIRDPRTTSRLSLPSIPLYR